jgi:murein DD-endopeptidase
LFLILLCYNEIVKKFCFLFIGFITPVCAGGVDFPVSPLTASGFPDSRYDHSFTERVSFAAAGYAPFESDWDADGNCISGCAYPGMNIETEAARLERDLVIAREKIADYQSKVSAVPIAQVAALAPTPSVARCRPANTKIPVAQKIPLGAPFIGNLQITSRFQPARKNPVDGIVRDHNGTDFAAAIGTPIFSPADGIVENVWTDTACGKGIIIRHSDGFSTGYCHLSDNSFVRTGDAVQAGCMIAKTGNTGRSTGPHLHYMVYLNNLPIPPENMITQ